MQSLLSFSFSFVLSFSLLALFSCKGEKLTLDSPPKLTRLNAANYPLSGKCPDGALVSVEYRVKKKGKQHYGDLFRCQDDRWSGQLDLSTINRNKASQVTLLISAARKFAPGESKLEATVQVIPDNHKAFIDDSALNAQINAQIDEGEGDVDFRQLIVSGGCADEGDELTLLLGEEEIDRVFCHRGVWQIMLDLENDEGEAIVQHQFITIRHQDEEGGITEDSYQFSTSI